MTSPRNLKPGTVRWASSIGFPGFGAAHCRHAAELMAKGVSKHS